MVLTYFQRKLAVLVHFSVLNTINYFQWQVKKDDATYSETPVEISGSEDQIKKAKEMIEHIIGPDSSVTNNMGGMTSSQYH